LTDVDRRFARKWLDRRFTNRAPLVVVHPTGGSHPLKQWPAEKFGELLERLRAVESWNFLIIGGKDESWITDEFSRHACETVVLGVGSFTLRQLAAVLERAWLFIGGDSGPMHIAAAVQNPVVVGIFGPTSELRFRPWGRDCRIVSLRYPCSPDVLGTFQDMCGICRYSEPRCLTELSVERVVREVRAILSLALMKVE
jgi:ADP-heptose:LPS heptosyltransferase